jgi:predicted Zn finger-like uncharacterized protein
MTSITRCPSCGTAFRVRPHQLQARDGRVRCGRCSVVFDARETLAEHLDVGEPEADGSRHTPIFDPSADALPEPTREPTAERKLPDVPLADSGSIPLADRGSIPLADRGSIPLADRASVPLPDEERYDDELEFSDAEGDDYRFGPHRKRRARAKTVLWSLASLVLLAVLAGQVVYVFRSDIAARDSEARRMLLRACERLDCEVPLPGHADLVTIEVSEMHPEPEMPGILALSAVLRNRADFTQRQPWIELTLTDARDRAIARRVLAPRDYLGERVQFEQGLAAGQEQSLRLLLDTTGTQPTGYRLLLYYP